MKIPKIAVFPPERVDDHRRMLGALSALYDVEFVPTDDSSVRALPFALIFAGTQQEAIRLVAEETRALALVADETGPIRNPGAMVEFGNSASLSPSFRGRALPDDSVAELGFLDVLPADEILAQKDGHPFWVRHGSPAAALDLVAVPLPELADGGHLFDHFQHTSWAGLLPVLNFLKEVSPWTPPPLRACFMLDDPNLHWTSYGYADYRALARHAIEHNYHVSFATVPVDGWFVNPKAAAIFRQNQDRLSLLIHGNNHIYRELVVVEGENRRSGLAMQAIRRIERLEQKAELSVPRVMAAPHGACNHEMAEALLRAGFDAACISRGSIMARNPGLKWPPTIGLDVSEFLGKALPVIPRFRFSLERGSELVILLAAFLGQPIVPFGHHDDLADGLGLLGRLAVLINSVGEVQWGDMASIAETNFCTRRNADTLHLKLFSRRIRLTIPEGVTQLHIDRPWLRAGGSERLVARKEAAGRNSSYEVGPMIPVCGGEVIEVRSLHSDSHDHQQFRTPRTPLWAFTRRQLCEMRDRLRPVKDRMLRTTAR